MDRKRLLFISTRQFWPVSSGKDVTLYYNCKGLCEKFNYDIYLFCFSDKKADKNLPHPDFIHDVCFVDVPGVVKSTPTILKKSIFFNQWPIQNSIFYNKTIAKELITYYKQVKPNVVIIDMVRLTPYLDILPPDNIPHILFEDDILAKRYKRQLQASNSASISGYMAESMSGIVNKAVNSKWIKSLILKTEIKRLEKYEATLPQKFDYITFISPIETREFNAKYHTNKAITLTMGADVEYCAAGEAEPGSFIENSLSVVGNFSYGSNAASLEWIDKNVMPYLQKDVKYYVVGKFPNELKDNLQSKNIIFMGYVDDFRKTVKSTTVYLSPILFGTGIKTKIVEAMAMGMPVVTNSVGAEGLDVKNGEELFIVDNPRDMICVIKKLLENDTLRNSVGKKGQQFVRKYHNWETIYDVFGKMGL